MGLEADENHMISMQLFQVVGLHSILNPNSLKVFGFNVFKCITTIQLLIILISAIEFILNIYYCWENINEVTKYVMYFQSDVIATCELYYLLKKADEIWKCIQLTSNSYFSYKHHSKRIPEIGRAKSKSFSMFIMLLWIICLVSWIFVPYMITNYYIEINVDDKVYRYRFSALNCLFPVTDEFYNKHFIKYFCAESIILLCWGHTRMIFDILVTSTCIGISYQLKTIANSFSTFDNSHDRLQSRNRAKTLEREELKVIFELKELIQDQQKVVENMKNIYRILRPVMILQLALNSSTTMLLCSITIMNYFNGVSMISPVNIRQILATLTYISHLYFTCYLFEHVSEQVRTTLRYSTYLLHEFQLILNNADKKDSLNFAMYCGEWTEKSIQYKKLILFAMRMNNAQKLNLQVTKKKLVNFELFSAIMQTTYSMSSLLIKQCSKET